MRSPFIVDFGDLAFESGGRVLLELHLEAHSPGDIVRVGGTNPDTAPQLRAWCTAHGHRLVHVEVSRSGGADGRVEATIKVGRVKAARWIGARQAGGATADGVLEDPGPDVGLAARGAWIEPGGPEPAFRFATRSAIWAPDAGRLYRKAAASQWDPSELPWHVARAADPLLERAVVVIMAYLVENEQAALAVPARFLGQIHPHFAEVQHVLAAQVADEARHAHAFARRARLDQGPPVLSSASGRASLQTLLDEPRLAVAMFLLSVLGEGTFLPLLGFIERHGPDPCTRRLARLVRADEARHVAFGMSHLEAQCRADPSLRSELVAAVEARYEDLQNTTGLGEDVQNALVLLAAGGVAPDQIAAGWTAVQRLRADMLAGRVSRLDRLGFSRDQAEVLAALHTRNFM